MTARTSASTRSSDECLELLLDLDASDDQLDSPMLFCSARRESAPYHPDDLGTT